MSRPSYGRFSGRKSDKKVGDMANVMFKVTDNTDLSVRLFTDAILCQGWKGDKKVEDIVTDM